MVFHVPEYARLREGALATTAAGEGHNGAFDLESVEPGWRLWLICSDATLPDARDKPDWQWEHVSVHAYRPVRASSTLAATRDQKHLVRVPSWKEMCQVKRICWDAEDVVMQLHPAESKYVNVHPAVLHLWRPRSAAIPTPPKELVG